jgi:F0F1-type ATP synthase membrane subunit c/vacuolar-type H+-ATPase subunit K
MALVELQDKVDLAPELTVGGAAVSVTMGGGMVIVTVVDACAVPPAPVQLSMKLVVAVNALVVAVPLIALVPLHPPEAEQLVAPVELQVSVDVPPDATLPGLAEMDTVGAPA